MVLAASTVGLPSPHADSNGSGCGTPPLSVVSASERERASTCDDELVRWADEVQSLRREITELQAEKDKKAERHATRAVRLRGEQQKRLDDELKEHRQHEEALSAAARLLQSEIRESKDQARSTQGQIRRADEKRHLLGAERLRKDEMARSIRDEAREARQVVTWADEERCKRFAVADQLQQQKSELDAHVYALESELMWETARVESMEREQHVIPNETRELAEQVWALRRALEAEEAGKGRAITGIERGLQTWTRDFQQEQSEATHAIGTRQNLCESLASQLTDTLESVSRTRESSATAAKVVSEEIARLNSRTDEEVVSLEERYSQEEEQLQEEATDSKRRTGETAERWQSRKRDLREQLHETNAQLNAVNRQRTLLGQAVEELSTQQKELRGAITKGKQSYDQAFARRRCLARDMEFQWERRERCAKFGERRIQARAAQKSLLLELETEAEAISEQCHSLECAVRMELKQRAQDQLRQEEIRATEHEHARAEQEKQSAARCKEIMLQAHASVKSLLQEFEKEASAQRAESNDREWRLESVTSELAELRSEVAAAESRVESRSKSASSATRFDTPTFGGAVVKVPAADAAASAGSAYDRRRWSWDDFDQGPLAQSSGDPAAAWASTSVSQLPPRTATLSGRPEILAWPETLVRPGVPSQEASGPFTLTASQASSRVRANDGGVSRMASLPEWSSIGPPV